VNPARFRRLLRKCFQSGELHKFDESLLAAALMQMKPTRRQRGAIQAIRDERNSLAHNATRRLTNMAMQAMAAKLKSALVKLEQRVVTAAMIDELIDVSAFGDCETLLSDDNASLNAALDCRLEGDQLAALNSWEAAEAAYSRGLAFRGVIPEALVGRLYIRRSAALLRHGKVAAAQSDADEAVRLCPRSIDACAQKVECLDAAKDWSALCVALETTLALAANDKDSVRANELQARLSVARLSADRIARRESENLLYCGVESRGSRAAKLASLGIDVAKSPSAEPDFRNHKLFGEFVSQLPKGLQLVTKAKELAGDGDASGSFKLFLSAAEVYGEPEAMYNVAIYYANGNGVPRDLDAAIGWVRRAIACTPPPGLLGESARLGVACSYGLLGNWYHRGIVVEENGRLAIENWRSAIATHVGDSSAASNLGLVYLHGWHGEPHNIANARDYFRIACNTQMRLAEAMRNMALLWRRVGSARRALTWMQSARRFGMLDSETAAILAEFEQEAAEQRPDLEDFMPPALLAMDALRYQPEPVLATTHRRPTLGELEALPIPQRTPFVELLLQAKRSAAQFGQLIQSGDLVRMARIAARVILTPCASDVILDTDDMSRLCAVAQVANKEPSLIALLSPYERAGLAALGTEFLPMEPRKRSNALSLIIEQDPSLQDNVFLLERLGNLLSFNSDRQSREAAIGHLNRALAILAGTSATTTIPFAVGYRLGLLYARGIASSLLDDEETCCDFLRKFVKECDAASYGHRKLPSALYRLAQLELRKCSSTSTGLRGSEAFRALYQRARAAEAAMAPFMRPEATFPAKVTCDTAYNAMNTDRSSQSAVSPLSDAKKRGGAVLRKLGAALGWFDGDDILVLHYRAIHLEVLRRGGSESFPTETVMRGAQQPAPPSGSDADRAPISIDEVVAPMEDRVHLGRMLRVIVVAEPVKYAGWHCVVEDGWRAAIVVVIYNPSPAQLAKLTVGTVVSIRDPYCRISQDGTILVRVDWPRAALLFDAEASMCGNERMCWMCLRHSEMSLKHCARCARAKYCSVECQRKDYKEFGRKYRCLKK
jgi:TPR repeat protein